MLWGISSQAVLKGTEGSTTTFVNVYRGRNLSTRNQLAVYENKTQIAKVGDWIISLTGATPEVSFHKKTGLYFLRFNKRSLKLLCSSIEDFVPECMKHKIDLTFISVSERAQVQKQRAIRRHECAATYRVDDIV
jgi:hypothetical protein